MSPTAPTGAFLQRHTLSRHSLDRPLAASGQFRPRPPMSHPTPEALSDDGPLRTHRRQCTEHQHHHPAPNDEKLRKPHVVHRHTPSESIAPRCTPFPTPLLTNEFFVALLRDSDRLISRLNEPGRVHERNSRSNLTDTTNQKESPRWQLGSESRGSPPTSTEHVAPRAPLNATRTNNEKRQ